MLYVIIICNNNNTYETYIITNTFYGPRIVLSISYVFTHVALVTVVL